MWNSYLLKRRSVPTHDPKSLNPKYYKLAQVPECKQTFPAWVSEMSAYVKSLDQTHLVTIGEEGFFGEGTPQTGSNPQTWGSQIGQDFAVDHAASSIDFATLHFWPQNWERCLLLSSSCWAMCNQESSPCSGSMHRSCAPLCQHDYLQADHEYTEWHGRYQCKVLVGVDLPVRANKTGKPYLATEHANLAGTSVRTWWSGWTRT